jgi:ribokinase
VRLLVLGNAVIDLAYAIEHLPTPGETVLAAAKHVDVGGKGLNQAVAAARAGAPTRLVAAIGDDRHGELIRAKLAAEGLATDGLQVTTLPSDESIVLVTAVGENVIVSTAAAARSLSIERAAAEVDALATGDLLLLQGNQTQSLTRTALLAARRRGIRTMLNPSPLAFDYGDLLDMVDIAVVNAVEAAALGSIGAHAVIVTDGARGARLCTMGGEEHVPAPSVMAVDTTGAGDVVCGVVAAGVVLGLPLVDALRWAVAAAARKVARRGAFAGIPTAAELGALRP